MFKSISMILVSVLAAASVSAKTTQSKPQNAKRDPAQYMSPEACHEAVAKADKSGKFAEAEEAVMICQRATESACARKHEAQANPGLWLRELCHAKAMEAALQNVSAQ